MRGNFCIRWYSFEINLQCIFRYTRRFRLSIRVYVPEKRKRNNEVQWSFDVHRVSTGAFQPPLLARYQILSAQKLSTNRAKRRFASWFCAVGANGRDKVSCEALLKGLAGTLESRTRSSMCSLWVPVRRDRREEVSRNSHGHKSS